MDPRFIVALLMFIGASISDLRTRRVPNAYWMPFIAAAAAFLLADVAAGRVGVAYLAWAGGTTAAMYLFWTAGLYGGADAKALMLLAWLWPGTPDLATRFTPAIDSLVAATAFMVALPLGFMLWNLAARRAAWPAGLLGFRMSIEGAERHHVWPMQEATDDGWKWRYLQRPNVDTRARIAGLRRIGLTEVWVTPKIPFMVPLTVGLVAQALWGDLVLRAMAALLT